MYGICNIFSNADRVILIVGTSKRIPAQFVFETIVWLGYLMVCYTPVASQTQIDIVKWSEFNANNYPVEANKNYFSSIGNRWQITNTHAYHYVFV